MSEQKGIIIEHNINQPIFRLIPLKNNNLLIVLKSLIKCLKSPDYSLEEALDISINNQQIDAVCLWKNNIIIIKTNQKFYFIEINEANYNFNIISEFNLLEKALLRYQKMISLNNQSNLLINTLGKLIILDEHQPNLLQIEKILFGINVNSFIQIRKNEIVCNSSEAKEVYFLNFMKGNIISTINNINICCIYYFAIICIIYGFRTII